MATGPDDLTSWRPDDESYEVAEETAAEREHFLESIRKIEVWQLEDDEAGRDYWRCLDRRVYGKELCDNAEAAGVTPDQWRELPGPQRDMLLQRRQAPRKAR